MKIIDLSGKWGFDDRNAHADPLHVDSEGRVILFTLKEGQSIREHNAPHSPFYVVILRGAGVFTGGEGKDETVGPDSLLIFEPGENHSIRAVNELVFLGFMHGAPGARS